jgi:monovalent cation/proton antiporter MnhG/PhaG subunit
METILNLLSWGMSAHRLFLLPDRQHGPAALSLISFTRIHAAGLTDTLGASLILIGLMFQAGWGLVLPKLIVILLFSLLAGTTASHAMAKAALKSGMKPQVANHDATR